MTVLSVVRERNAVVRCGVTLWRVPSTASHSRNLSDPLLRFVHLWRVDELVSSLDKIMINTNVSCRVDLRIAEIVNLCHNDPAVTS